MSKEIILKNIIHLFYLFTRKRRLKSPASANSKTIIKYSFDWSATKKILN